MFWCTRRGELPGVVCSEDQRSDLLLLREEGSHILNVDARVEAEWWAVVKTRSARARSFVMATITFVIGWGGRWEYPLSCIAACFNVRVLLSSTWEKMKQYNDRRRSRHTVA